MLAPVTVTLASVKAISKDKQGARGKCREKGESPGF
jgi:hypothetical protein